MLVGLMWSALPCFAYNINPEKEELVPSGGRMEGSLYGWSLQHFDNKLYVGAPLTDNPTTNAVTECSLAHPPRCSSISVGGTSGLEAGEWMGGSMASSATNLYVCAFLQHRRYWALMASRGGSDTSAAITGACYKMSRGESQLTQNIDFFKFHRTCPTTATRCSSRDAQNLYETFGHWDFRKAGGHYGFTASISEDDQRLVVGNPVQRNYIWAIGAFAGGTVGEVHAGNVFKAPGPWHHHDERMKIKDTLWFAMDREYVERNQVSAENNIGKHASFSLAKGRFLTSSGPVSFVMGAPNADNFKGAVYLCTDCFGRDPRVTATMGVDLFSFQDKEHLQMGEGFGWSVAACDLNGDGLDDLIVGSPHYSNPKEEETYNTGRAHFFLSENDDKQWRGLSGASTLVETPSEGLQNGANFGYSMSCLGDTDGDGKDELVIGAPYFKSNQGAVFVYAMDVNSQLKETQLITGEKSFGMKMSQGKLEKAMNVPGLGVGAPEASKAFYMKIRPVLRISLNDQVISIEPKRVHKETASFNLTIDPSVHVAPSKWSAPDFKRITDQEMQVKVTITPTERIKQVAKIMEKTQDQTINFNGSSKVVFQYSGYANRFGDLDMLDFNVTLRYVLSCSFSSSASNCPAIFAPDLNLAPRAVSILPGGQALDVTLDTFQETSFPINTCLNTICKCDISAQIVKGSEGVFVVVLRNSGTEPAFDTQIIVDRLEQSEFVFEKNPLCSGRNCRIKTIEPNKTKSLEVKIKKREGETDHQTSVTVAVTSNCETPSPQSERVPLSFKHQWALEATANKPHQQVNFDYRDVARGGDSEAGRGTLYSIRISYSVTNIGPNLAHKPKVYILLPMDKLWLTMDWVPRVGWVWGDQCAEVTNPFTKLQMKNALWDEGKKETLTERHLSVLNEEMRTVFECTIPYDMWPGPGNATKVEIELLLNRDQMMVDPKPRSSLLVTVGICTEMSNDGRRDILCDETDKSTTTFQYFWISNTVLIIDDWEPVLMVAVCLNVIFVQLVVFWMCDCFRMARMYKFDKQETDVKNEEEEQKEEQGGENVGENPRENQEEESEAESEREVNNEDVERDT